MSTVLRDLSPPAGLAGRYDEVRGYSERLCEPLATEDYVVQSMADVSPTKWHLAHTSWFFEAFVLTPHLRGYRPLDSTYAYLFNSYYVQAGERHCRDQRGYLSRPTVEEVFAYRRHVDQAMRELLGSAEADLLETIAPLVEIGMNHEQQHQELMLTDIKHVFSVNPLRPAYRDPTSTRVPGVAAEAAGAGTTAAPAAGPVRWVAFPGGLHEIGHDGTGFAYDNEGPRHRVYLEPYTLADRLVTNGDYLEFMEHGGYERAELWLSLGRQAVEQGGWSEPFYWEKRDGDWWTFTLSGMGRVDPAGPLVHISYFEADAFARWADARLPTEAEWEVAAAGLATAGLPVTGNLVESGRLHPSPDRPEERATNGPRQMFGDVWEWTQSPYAAYPGYRPPTGALGEYNGKFMCNQFVLRGGSCATPATHIRATYRNFFPPEATWQFTGLRLARDA